MRHRYKAFPHIPQSYYVILASAPAINTRGGLTASEAHSHRAEYIEGDTNLHRLEERLKVLKEKDRVSTTKHSFIIVPYDRRER